MRAIQVKDYVQDPLDLRVTELPDPDPLPDQYVIAVKACATNFFDLLQIRGKYQDQPPFPWVSGAEFSGVILQTPSSFAERRPKFNVGDRVFGTGQGGFASKVCVAEFQLQPVPQEWSFYDAAGLFVTMPTSYAALVMRAGIKQGDWVLVHAAAGGVGLAAVQIAKALGAIVVATAGTNYKLEIAKSFGADFGVNYLDESWPQKVLELTPRKQGVDIVYDPVGLIEKSQKCIACDGRLLVIGFARGSVEKMATNRVLLKNSSVVGLYWGSYVKNKPEKIAEVWGKLHELIECKKIRATNYTDKEYKGLDSVPEALYALSRRETWGKVVVDLQDVKESKL